MEDKLIVTVPIELDEVAKNDLEDVLSKVTEKNIKAHFEVDPKILGGIVVSLGGKTIDLSLKGKIKEIMEVLSNG